MIILPHFVQVNKQDKARDSTKALPEHPQQLIESILRISDC
jgi:hypothetical protein